MDGRLFLGTARFLRNNGSDEAAYRSAVSRAYYACFIVTRDLAFRAWGLGARRKAGIKNERNIGHDPLQRYLKSGATESIRQLGQDLAALHGSRKDADYNMKQVIAVEDAQDSIEEAEAILELLSQIPNKDVGETIDNYVRTVYR